MILHYPMAQWQKLIIPQGLPYSKFLKVIYELMGHNAREGNEIDLQLNPFSPAKRKSSNGLISSDIFIENV